MFDVQSKKVLFMSALAEASHLIKEIGGSAESKKERRLKAWRKVASHFSWNRIVDLDRGAQHARVSGDELNILRAAARQQEAESDGRRELRELVARIARLEARLLATDPDFHREEIAGLRSGAGLGGDDCSAVDRG